MSDFQALRELFLILLGLGGAELLLKDNSQLREIDLLEQLHDRLRAHHCSERAVAIGVFGLAELDLGEQLADFQGGVALVSDYVVFVINYALQLAGAHIEHQADARWHALVEPDVGNGNCELDVAHALTADAAESHLDTAAVADHALVLDAFVFSAGTFPVTGRAEDALAEEPTFFRLERPVVDRFRIFHLTF